MKKISAIILLLVLALMCTSAFAAGTDGLGSHVTRNGELAAFMDDSGNIFVSGLHTSINATPAQNLISIDPYRILFLARADEALSVPTSRLISIDLESHAETIITDDAAAACAGQDIVYFVSAKNPAHLYAWDASAGKTAKLLDGAEAIERVYPSANGIIVSMVENAGAYIQDAVSGAFVPYSGNIASEIISCGEYDLYLTDSHDLYIIDEGMTGATLVDTGVQNWTVLGGKVYYLTGTSDSLTLKCYDAETAFWSTVLQNQTGFEMQLSASEKKLFMLSSDNKVYTVENGMLRHFADLPDFSSVKLGNGRTLNAYHLEAVSGQLNIYGSVSREGTLPTFTFVDFSTQAVADESSSLVLLSAYAIDDEQTVWDLLQPAPKYSEKPLRRGSRGEAVTAIQERLAELEYYDYNIDGIFGWRTERAVKLLQADLGLSTSGAADADLQRIILEGNLEAYDPYRVLSKGDRGLRVQDMQERLRDLGFLADDADAVFGSRTQAAVELFQYEHNLEETGIADAKTLKKLYSSSAKPCASYIDLQKGDTGYRVRELNSRLKELYYLEGEVGSSYNSATVAAVKRFQEETGIKQTGAAGASLQKKLFSKNAPEYSGYITLRRGDRNSRVKQLQQRLKKLNYYNSGIDSYFGPETQAAVKLFQRVVGIKATGIADPNTLALIFATDAPVYSAPEKITKPVIELSNYTGYENGIYIIADSATTNGSITASWFSDGDVDGYDLLIYDNHDYVYIDKKGLTTADTMIGIPVTSLDPARTYTIKVTAYPRDYADDEPAASKIRFERLELIPDPTPEPTEEPTPKPTEEPVITAEPTQEPVVTEEPTTVPTEEPVITEAPTTEPTTEPVVTEEPTQEPIITEEPTPEPTEEPTPEPTEEPTPEPTEEPTPEPTEEPTPESTEEPTPEPTEEPTPEPTEEPTPEPTEEPAYPSDDPSAWKQPVDAESDPAAIKVIQKRLVEWMWLESESFNPGALDVATIDAVISFQNYCAESGLNVTPWSEEMPEIGIDTLWLLFNADGLEIFNPYV